MKLANFLVGMFGVVIVFAISTYVMTGSAWAAFTQGLLCFVLMQAGYFSMVVFLIARRRWSAYRSRKLNPVQGSGVSDAR